MQVRQPPQHDPAARELHDVDAAALYSRAVAASKHAYAPYSAVRVGAALLTADGSVITAGNVENSSYGLTICAERAAIVCALAGGHRRFAAIAVAVETDRVHTAVSCGACLQVLAEFDQEETLLCIFRDGDSLRVSPLSELMPIRFQLQTTPSPS